MSIPCEPIAPPPSVLPLDNPLRDPDRIPGEEPLPDLEPGEGPAATRRTANHSPTWGLLCSGVRLQTEGRT